MLLETPEPVLPHAHLEELYLSTFPRVAAFVKSMQGNLEDARDIFQDALVIYLEKAQRGQLAVYQSEQSYLLGIVKHLWIRKFRRDAPKVSLDDAEQTINLEDAYFPLVNETRLLQILEQSGKRCLDLLRAFYYQNLSMKKIAAFLGFKSERSATVQKYKCLEKLRNVVKEKSISYEEFFE
ncbi:MAG: sigma-70 family RNA polymerase sigma factor [Bacteroidia bacterium]|nr:sigma-70 family RNA polymerase sigma factor [Bacteroidia bacterium]